MFAHTGRPEVSIEELVSLDHSAGCIFRRFVRDADVGITWEVLTKLLQQLCVLLFLTQRMKLIQQPGLFTGLSHILAYFHTTSDSNSLANRPPPQPTNITTLPVSAQLSTILSDTVYFDHGKFHESYNIHDTSSSSTLMEEITTAPDPLILFVSGNVARNGEKATFRYLLPWSGGDDSAGLFLFQLNPFHEVFRGNGTRPGWVLEREELIFGERYNGVVLVLAEDLKRAALFHDFSG